MLAIPCGLRPSWGLFPCHGTTVRRGNRTNRPTFLVIGSDCSTCRIIVYRGNAQQCLFTVDASPWREIAHGIGAFLVVVMSYASIDAAFLQQQGAALVRLYALWDDLVLISAPVIGVLAWYLREPALFFEYIFAFGRLYFPFVDPDSKEDLAKVKAYVAGGEVEMPLIHKDLIGFLHPLCRLDETGRPVPSKDSSSLRAHREVWCLKTCRKRHQVGWQSGLGHGEYNGAGARNRPSSGAPRRSHCPEL